MLRGRSGRAHRPGSRGSESSRGKAWRGKQPGPDHSTRSTDHPFRGQGVEQRRGRAQSRTVVTSSYSRTNGGPQARRQSPVSDVARTEPIQDRWQALRKAHNEERTSAIAKGLIADPDRPRALEEATTLVGTCQDMCPEYERVERIVQKDIWKDEWDPTKLPEKVVAEHRMIKKFRRAAAGLDEQLPSDLRPPLVLQKTVDYLFKNLINETIALENVHHFIWDRTRAIRNDFSIQQLTKLSDVRVAVDCYERIARFHIVSLHELAQSERPYDMYDVYQEREQLDRTLLSLMQYYKDTRTEFRSPNEAEFRAYTIILQTQDPLPDLEDRMQSWPVDIVEDARVQRALKLHTAAGNVTDSQGPLKPRQPYPITQGNWAHFWSLVGSDEVSYLMACVAEIYFTLVRQTALHAIWLAYRQGPNVRSEDWSLGELAEVFGLDDEDQVQKFSKQHRFETRDREDGLLYLDLTSVHGKRLPDPPRGTRYQSYSEELVEPKRYGRTLSAVIDGMSVEEAEKAGYVEEVESEEDGQEDVANDSLFLPASHAIGKGSRAGATGIIQDTQDTEPAREENEQKAIGVSETSKTRIDPKVSQNPFATQSSLERSSSPASSNTSNNPFALNSTGGSTPGTGISNLNPFEIAKSSKPLAGNILTPGLSTRFGKPSATATNNIASTDRPPASTSLLHQTDRNLDSTGNYEVNQTRPNPDSPFTINKSITSVPPKHDTSKDMISSEPVFSSKDSFDFAMSTSSTATPSLLPTSEESSRDFVHPFALQKPTVSDPVQRSSESCTPCTSSKAPSSTARPEAGAISQSPLATHTEATPREQKWQQLEPLMPTPSAANPNALSQSSLVPASVPATSISQSSPDFPFPTSIHSVHQQDSRISTTNSPVLSALNPAQISKPTNNQSGLGSISDTVQTHSSTLNPQQNRPAIASTAGSLPPSPGVFKATPSYQKKHQPSRPSPLSHVTTFASDSSPSPPLPLNASATPQPSALVGSLPKSNMETRQPLISTRPTSSARSVDIRVNLLDSLTFQVFLDDNVGLLRQFVEHVSHHEVDSALKQFQAEEVQRKALEIRNDRLARKYGQRWRQNCWKRRMMNRSRERRAKKVRQLLEQQEEVKKAQIEARRQRLQMETNRQYLLNQQVSKASPGCAKRRSNELDTDAEEGASKKLKAKSIRPIYEPNVSATNALSNGAAMFDKVRNPMSFVKSQQQAATRPTREPREETPISSVQPDPDDAQSRPSIRPNRSLGKPNTGYDSEERASTTQSSYFRLKAMGINPNADRNRKRIREESVSSTNHSAELVDTRDSELVASPEPKRLQTSFGRRVYVRSAAPTTVPATVPRARQRQNSLVEYSPSAGREQRAAVDAADEARFARLRRAREALNQATSKLSHLKSRPLSRRSWTSHRAKSSTESELSYTGEDADILTQSKQLRQMMADSIEFFQDERKKEEEYSSRSSSRASPRVSGRSVNDLHGNELGAGAHVNVPKYRLRESNFVPREKYGKWIQNGSAKAGHMDKRTKLDTADLKAVEPRQNEGKGNGACFGEDEDGALATNDWNEPYKSETDEQKSGIVSSPDDPVGPLGEENSIGESVEEDEYDEDEVGSQDYDDEEDIDEEYEDGEEEINGGNGFIAHGLQFGIPVSTASTTASGAQPQPFDPKGKTGTSAEDAYELSD